MKTNILLTLAFFVLCSTHVYAQDYDLNTYDFRYQKYRGLSLDFDLGSNGNQSFNSTQDTFARDSTFSNSHSNSSSFNISPSYFSFTNTDALQRTVSASIRGNFNFDSDKTVSTNGRASDRGVNNEVDLSYSNTSLFYSGEKFKYFQVSTRSEFNNMCRRQKFENGLTEEMKDWSIDNSTSVSYGFGRGRINDVTDAVQAMFILQDLHELDGVTYSNEQIENIAKGITEIKNARYLDFRIGYKTQLRMLDRVLLANGVSVKNSVDYFTTISDNWLYANRIQRSSGSRWTHYVTADNYYRVMTSNEKNSRGNDVYGYKYSIERFLLPRFHLRTAFTRTTQKSLYVQRGFGFTASSGFQFIRNNAAGDYSLEPINRSEIEFGTASEEIESLTVISGTYNYLYQPNTRSTWTINIRPTLVFAQTLPKYASSSATRNRRTLQPYLNINSDYYHWFSPHLNVRAAGSLAIRSSFNNREDEFVYQKSQYADFDYNLSLGLNYQLF
jgi:hypothetical protein